MPEKLNIHDGMIVATCLVYYYKIFISRIVEVCWYGQRKIIKKDINKSRDMLW